MVYLTTVDNPWNPFTNWDEWLRYDIGQGYFTCERLARLAPISDVLPDTINDEMINDAMDTIIKEGAYNKNGEFIEYKKVYKEEPSKQAL